MQISSHFSLFELTVSETAARQGIDNTPPPEAIENLKLLCNNVLEPLRFALQKPILITSGYRSPELNKAIGGAISSQHCLGGAADIHVSGMSIDELFNFIKNSDIPFDQLINEYGNTANGWVHVSYGYARHEALAANRVEGKTIYTPVV